jgi:hypothetical protein
MGDPKVLHAIMYDVVTTFAMKVLCQIMAEGRSSNPALVFYYNPELSAAKVVGMPK